MKIVINQTCMIRGFGLVMITNLLENLLLLDEKNAYVVYTSTRNEAYLTQYADRFPNAVIKVSRFASRSLVARLLWEQVWLPLLLVRERADVLFSPLNLATLVCPCRQVLYVSGVLQFMPRELGLKQRLRSLVHKALAVLSLNAAGTIVFISHTALELTRQYLYRRGSRIEVVFPGVTAKTSVVKLRPKEVATLEARPYILSVSTLYRYKNYESLIRGLAGFLEKSTWTGKLIIVGESPPEERRYHDELCELVGLLGLEDRVVFAGEQRGERLAWLYQNAYFYVTTSLIESYGMTVPEAFAYGLPCIVSDIPAFREIASGAVLYVDPRDADDITGKMLELHNDPGLAERLRCAGRAVVAGMTWEKCAMQYLALFGDERGRGRRRLVDGRWSAA